MNPGRLAAVGIVALVVAAGGAAAFVAGIGPLGDAGGDSSDVVTETPASTGTVYGDTGGSSGGDDGGGDAGTAGSDDSSSTESAPPYTFVVEAIEKCGQTCRDVTVRLDNDRDETATGVSVHTRIFAGNSTDSGDRVWKGTRDVGSLEAGASTTETSRVELSYSEGYQIRQDDGWITILTTVESDDVTITFNQRRQVL